MERMIMESIAALLCITIFCQLWIADILWDIREILRGADSTTKEAK